MNKQEFINIIDIFLSNIELEYIDINGQIQQQYFSKLLKTTDINLNDLPNDSIEKIFITKIEFVEIVKEYYRIITQQLQTYVFGIKYRFENELIDDYSFYKHIRTYIYTGTNNIINIENNCFKQYDKSYIKNTYLKFTDYLFFKKYFNIDFSQINIYYPIKIISKKDYNEISNLFNIPIKYQNILTCNNTDVKIEDNKVIGINGWHYLSDIKAEFYNNYYYNFYDTCSLFNVIKYFIFGLLQYKQEELNQFFDINQEKIEIQKINENIDITVSKNMIQRFNYDTINEDELKEELRPIPTEDMYANEQHIILQGIFEDIQKFCNNLQKYISGGQWKFDNINYEDLNIDDKIKYLETILTNYNKNMLDLRGYNSYFKSVKRDIIVGDSDKLNYLNLTESENNFLHIEKMLQNNKYPLFAKLNLINTIKQTIAIYLNTIKSLADNKKFYNEEQTEILLPQLRSAYNELAKAVASQEQPLSFGNPSYDGNPNEYPFRQEQP